MHKAWIRKNLMRVVVLFGFFVIDSAHAELRDSQMFRPIEWEESMTSSKFISFSWLTPMSSVALARASESDAFDNLKHIFGFQFSRPLNNRWKGRLGLFISSTGAQRGQELWSFAGSDLQHSLTPSSWKEQRFFSWFQPVGYFGLGFASRWKNAQVRYNLIPTFRYDESEPAAYLGVSSMVRLLGDSMIEVDLRYFQSARDAKHRFVSLGGSLILWRWASL